MAKLIQVITVCDVTGEADPDTRTQFFGIGRDYFEIDLSPKAAKVFSERIGYYITRARLVADRPKRSSEKPAVQVDRGKVRRWCEHVGIDVNPNGNIKREAVNAYLEAWIKDAVPAEFL